MACCCKGCQPTKSSVSCLGRCDLPKHRCLEKRQIKPGPIPKNMGWLYTAKDSPEHQLRCGWRPGHISCEVLRKIEQHNCTKTCRTCPSTCARFAKPAQKACCAPPKHTICPSASSCCKGPSCRAPDGQPLIRVIRHNGQYSIATKPSNVSNAPSSPYALKYVLNTDADDQTPAKFSVEAKFNDYQFDYASSQTSFVLDFSPPESKCYKPYPKESIVCLLCQPDCNWPC